MAAVQANILLQVFSYMRPPTELSKIVAALGGVEAWDRESARSKMVLGKRHR